MKRIDCFLFLCLIQTLLIFSVTSLPISTTIHRSLDESDAPRSTFRMSFGNSGSTTITAHSSHGAISSIHDAIDLHRQVKQTVSSVRNLVRSKKQQRAPPSSAGRVNAYHPYARTGKGMPQHTGRMEEHDFEQSHPHLQHESPQEMYGAQANHPILVHQPGMNHKKPYYSMAAETPYRNNHTGQRA